MKPEAGLVSVVTALPDRETASEFARLIIEKRLAACVQVAGPVTSFYRWQGSIHADEEWVCTMKTPEHMAGELTSFIRSSHPYDTPEILLTEADGSSPAYLRWANESTAERD
jgi:periplasmic divalent cation tolerance protein